MTLFRRLRRRRRKDDLGQVAARSFLRVKLEGTRKQAIETGRIRLLATGALFALAFVVVGGQLVKVSLFGGDYRPPVYHGEDTAGYSSARADIIDRNGVLVATNLPTASLYADPALVLDAEEAAARIATVLPELDREALLAGLESDHRFVWIKRHLAPRQQYEINRLGLPGLAFERDEHRVYPHGPLLAHVLGYTDIDNRGLAGLEFSLDSRLAGEAAQRGEPLALSIDLRVQHLLHEELSAAVEEFDALGAAGLVLDVETGEVLAMVSLPDFDPNLPGRPGANARFNRATLGVYEMGSTFKIFTLAAALDSGVVTLNDGYDASEPIKISRYWIRDYHPENRFLTVPEIFMYSSNIGAAKMALDIGTERQRDFLASLGLLNAPEIELPERGAPLVPSPWREINTMTISFGHGIAVPPLNLARATAAMVNGGLLRPASLLKHDATMPVPGVPVIRPETSDIMRALLRMVVGEGTGKNATAPGFQVGGKTGTSEKVVSGNYQRKALITSFVGAFPMDAPRYVVLVMVDEPHGNAKTFGYATAGWTAAPSVGRVIARIGPLLGIVPIKPDASGGAEDLLVTIQTREAELASF
jgi:cell division protein FtsI (penicillin-binding protein 3)